MMIVSGGVAIGGFTGEEEEEAGRDRTTKAGRRTHSGIGKEQKNIQIISRNGIFFSLYLLFFFFFCISVPRTAS